MTPKVTAGGGPAPRQPVPLCFIPRRAQPTSAHAEQTELSFTFFHHKCRKCLHFQGKYLCVHGVHSGTNGTHGLRQTRVSPARPGCGPRASAPPSRVRAPGGSAARAAGSGAAEPPPYFWRKAGGWAWSGPSSSPRRILGFSAPGIRRDSEEEPARPLPSPGAPGGRRRPAQEAGRTGRGDGVGHPRAGLRGRAAQRPPHRPLDRWLPHMSRASSLRSQPRRRRTGRDPVARDSHEVRMRNGFQDQTARGGARRAGPGHLSSGHPSPGHPSPGHLSPRHLSPKHLSPKHLSPEHLSSGHLSSEAGPLRAGELRAGQPAAAPWLRHRPVRGPLRPEAAGPALSPVKA